ncbi:conjugative transposon protein TraJ [Pedobacter sp.]|uniref:conjugative transposon protein TraJ n=1 Tax=Pedobacter sp. TaxID=1411316 RepID=UPI003BA9F375
MKNLFHSLLKGSGLGFAFFLLPQVLFAQGLAGELSGMQSVLGKVYQEMIPLSSRLIDVARGIAGFAALWYIASRVWRQIAAAEPIDFYPLMRPFALGLCIMLFPAVLGIINGVLQPTVSATGAMVSDSNIAIERLLKVKEQAIKRSKNWQMYVGDTGQGDSDKWYKYTHPNDPQRNDETFLDGLGNSMQFWMEKQSYNLRNSIKSWLKEVLEVLYAAASLCINTIRTFFLIVLAILGPLVLGFAVFDGFQQTVTVWLARYVNIFLWLPIANIFGSILGKIQENMLKVDLSQIEAQGDTFFSSTDTAYLVFLIIGIVGYFSVPSVASFIVHAGGGNAVLSKVNSMVIAAPRAGVNAGLAAGGMAADALGDQARMQSQGYASAAQGDYFTDQNSHQKQKISGKHT